MATLLAVQIVIASSARAENPFTSLIEPDDVIQGHAEFGQDCTLCHTKFKREQQTAQCRDCHDKIDSDIKETAGFHGRSKQAKTQACRDCHTEHKGRDADIINFKPDQFLHTLTDFPLIGGHRGVDCATCHQKDQLYRDAPTQCQECHAEDDNHHGEFGELCADCHSQLAWTEVKFDHSETGWPLLGGHSEVECSSCHVSDSYADAQTSCISCHRDTDSHEGYFGTQCADCHVVDGWGLVKFNHDNDTKFPLFGQHSGLTCNLCHSEPLYSAAMPSQCNDCHRKDDVHEGVRGSQCDSCHSETNWLDAEFDHFQMSGFALNGKHEQADCATCHAQPAGTVELPQTCHGCHDDDDPHRSQLGSQCQQCHNENTWTGMVAFDHALTSFPLLGQHETLECSSCHESSAFKDAPTQCIDCHREDDRHAGSLGQACANCHSTQGWALWSFEHTDVSDFALTGAHETASCSSCHEDKQGRRVEAPSTNCADCHRSDDEHFGEFGNQCGRCHTTKRFSELKAVH